MKGGHYRSTKNYISSIKRYHRLCGFDWHDQLDLAYTSFVASTQRGIGPGKQSSPLPFSKFGSVDLNTEMANDEYPVKSGWCAVLFTFFLLRELECATAEFADVALDPKKQTVKMTLSVSKNDPRALGCDRVWGCVCPDAGDPDPRTCPYHAAEALVAYLTLVFGDAVKEEGFPLFPNRRGCAVSAEVMLELIVDIAAFFGEPIKNKAGQNRFGKHSWRATGAVHLGECGVEVHKIMLMGRWHCTVVLLYTRTSPISNIANDYKRARSSIDTPLQLKSMEKSFKKVKALIDKTAGDMEAEVRTLSERLRTVERHARPEYVVNRRTGRWHKILTSFADAGGEAIAYCGYKFAAASARCRFEIEVPDDIPKEDVCVPCLGEARATRPAGQ